MYTTDPFNTQILSIEDDTYPNLLKEISDPPQKLWIKGDIQKLQSMQLAIVGSRNPTHNGRETALRFAGELSEAGFVITSGLAMGIDTAAHCGALEKKAITIAVLGTGIDMVYPRQNAALAERIVAEGGVLVSEYPPGTPPRSYQFPKRNRIICGLSLGVLVVEAAEKSGSLITARLAGDYNRELFAIPGSIYNPLSQGCHSLLRQGATLVRSTEDICAEFNHLQSQPQSHHGQRLAWEGDLLVKCIGYEPTPFDILVARSSLSAATVAVKLLDLELMGAIIHQPGGYMRKV